MPSEFARCVACGRQQSLMNSMFCTTCDEYVCHLCMTNVCPVCNTSNLISAQKGPTSKRIVVDFSAPTAEKKSGCFIATAAYGSQFAPEVLAFRRFRDEVLLASKIGTGFVKFYYFISPPLASLISKHRSFRVLTIRFLLKPALHLIKKEGNQQ